MGLTAFFVTHSFNNFYSSDDLYIYRFLYWEWCAVFNVIYSSNGFPWLPRLPLKAFFSNLLRRVKKCLILSFTRLHLNMSSLREYSKITFPLIWNYKRLNFVERGGGVFPSVLISISLSLKTMVMTRQASSVSK